MSEEPEVEKATGKKKEARNTFRILIMDTVEHTDQLKAACQRAGHDVVGVQSIKEAFAFLDGTNHADVIVCAAHLEDESMFEFLRRLRTNPIHKDSMFMTLSLEAGRIGAKVNESTEKAGRLLGADAFVSMPVFDAEVLISEISTLLPQVPMLETARLESEKQEKSDN